MLACSRAHAMVLSGVMHSYVMHDDDMRVQHSETDTFYTRIIDY